MNILVIGGSYFFGRWFVEVARKEHNITVLNRGNIPLNLENVIQWTADRHDTNALDVCRTQSMPGGKEDFGGFDCIVDFCAYSPGDIETIAKYFGNEGTRYIFISTVDVYKKGTGETLTEESELMDPVASKTSMNATDDEVEAYIRGKCTLEKELLTVAENTGIVPVSVRPAILYGPVNYAPREKMYFDWIEKANQILAPIDSDGRFQFIYVKDAALGLLKLCGMSESELKTAYNFCSPEISTYYSFHLALHEAGKSKYYDFQEIPVTVKQVYEQGIPLPFPLTKEESEVYDAGRFMELGVFITSLSEGLCASWLV